jgi:hypothetical protein
VPSTSTASRSARQSGREAVQAREDIVGDRDGQRPGIVDLCESGPEPLVALGELAGDGEQGRVPHHAGLPGVAVEPAIHRKVGGLSRRRQVSRGQHDLREAFDVLRSRPAVERVMQRRDGPPRLVE